MLAHPAFNAVTNSEEVRGFSALDARLTRASGGIVLAHTASRNAMVAVMEHAVRRLREHVGSVVTARARSGASLWQEVAAYLRIETLDHDAARWAGHVASAANAMRAAIVMELPAAGSWDHLVAIEISRLPNPPGIVFVTDRFEHLPDLHGDRIDVNTLLDAHDKRRWFSALVDDARRQSDAEDVTDLEQWWSRNAKSRSLHSANDEALSSHAKQLLQCLALADRAWAVRGMPSFGIGELGLSELRDAGLVRIDAGMVVVAPHVESSVFLGDLQMHAQCVAEALSQLGAADPWAYARAAELFLSAGLVDQAEGAHAQAVVSARHMLIRQEVLARWIGQLESVDPALRLPMQLRGAQRALDHGESEQAYRCAQRVIASKPEHVEATLVFARASMLTGDYVAAKLALDRLRRRTLSPGIAAEVAMASGEIALAHNDYGAATADANAALDATTDTRTRLNARRILGKVLLAQLQWREAEAHFAEDAFNASVAGEKSAELQARMNRGRALRALGQDADAKGAFELALREATQHQDARAAAFAVSELAALAMASGRYGEALGLWERALEYNQRAGDHSCVAKSLFSIAQIRFRLGLLDHADHAIAFGRRIVRARSNAAYALRFANLAARVALAKKQFHLASTELASTLEGDDGNREARGEALRIAVRLALHDGDTARAKERLAAAREVSHARDDAAEIALLCLLVRRACGDLRLADVSLDAFRGDRECMTEAFVIVAEMHRDADDASAAWNLVQEASRWRNAVVADLSEELKTSFLSRGDMEGLSRLEAELKKEQDVVSVRQAAPLSVARGADDRLVGNDTSMRALRAAIRKVARANSTVLVHGESGTGKELVAAAIHLSSDRAARPMVTVNCAALVETLLLSELFGHEKGAFTGASARRRGRFEVAEGGTLFLDEIGDISARTQVALLRVLQERTFERVGGTAPIRCDVRIVCATHRDLRSMVERGEFREDLYYRLRGITLEVPPLRARLGDVGSLSDDILARIAAERDEAKKSLSGDALDLLVRHRWPGNVRELENALRAASLFADGAVVTAAHLTDNVDDLRPLAHGNRPSHWESQALLYTPGGDADRASTSIANDSVPAAAPSEATAVAYAQVRQGAVSLSDMKRQIERDCIARALAETHGNITKAAVLLGMKRPRLSQLVKQFSLSSSASDDPT